MLTEVYITGTGMTKFGKKKETFYKLVLEAAKEALDESFLRAQDISDIVIGTQDTKGFLGKEEEEVSKEVRKNLSEYFKVGMPAPKIVDAMSASGAAALHEGYKLISDSDADNVLVIGAQKMTHLERKDLTSVIAKVIEQEIRKEDDTATMLKIAAKVMSNYEEHELTYADLDQMAAELHIRADLNEYASFFKKFRTSHKIWNTILNTKKNWITAKGTDFRLFYSTSTDDGTAALVLSNKNNNNLIKPIRIIGHGEGYASPILEKRDKEKYFFDATYKAARNAFGMAGIQPKDLFGNVLVEAHDAFLNYVFPQLVGVGFYDNLEESVQAFRRGDWSIDGIIPTNVSGGLKGRGHPLGASSLAQVIEIVKQMRVQAGDLQLNRIFNYGISTAIGGPAVKNYVTILQRC